MVGLEFTVVQTGVLGFLASSSANFHIEHIFQAFHYLKKTESRAWVTWFRSGGMAAPLAAGSSMKSGGKDALIGLVHATWKGSERWKGNVELTRTMVRRKPATGSQNPPCSLLY